MQHDWLFEQLLNAHQEDLRREAGARRLAAMVRAAGHLESLTGGEVRSRDVAGLVQLASRAERSLLQHVGTVLH